jgi:polysaccharide biosynthesis protein PslJ
VAAGDVTTRELPAWPLVGMFWTFPISWVLGLGAFLSPLWGAIMVAYLMVRRSVTFPRPMVLWGLFLLIVLASGLMLDSAGRMLGSLFRFGNYAGATAAFLYVYNSTDRTLPDRRVAMALTMFWVWVVAGGYLGVLIPDGSLSTPMERLMPGALLENELVREWVHPSFAELQQPWGSPVAFARPSAPFAYTNGWGNNFAILMPFVVAMAGMSHGRRRVVLGLALAASAVPAVATLNRGMFVALGVGLVYAMLLLAFRGRIAPLLSLLAVVLIAGIALAQSGVLDRIMLRTTYSATNIGRATVYEETFDRTLSSPLLGWGGPRPSRTLDISVGTQGHVWNVMFSHGFLALALFVSTLLWLAWRTRRCTGLGFASHITLVMIVVAITYYGYDGPQMLVALTAAALGTRQVDRCARRALTGAGSAQPPITAARPVGAT